MSDETLASHVPARLTAERYLALVEEGVLEPDDRVELLEGIIVAKEPQTPWHASGVRWVFDTLVAALGSRALVTQRARSSSGRARSPSPTCSSCRERERTISGVTRERPIWSSRCPIRRSSRIV